MAFTTGANVNMFGNNPVRLIPTLCANKAIGPIYGEQIVVTGSFICKSFIKFDLAFWKVFGYVKLCHDRPPQCF